MIRTATKVVAVVLTLAATIPAAALPILQFEDNMDGTVDLQVVIDGPGSLGAEVAVAVEPTGTLAITGVTVNETLFDTPNPGDNPFIPGSPVGGDTTGLFTNLLSGQVFAAFGAGDPGLGTFDFLTFEIEGFGELQASGLVAQGGSLNDGLTASLTIVPEPASLLVASGCLALVASRTRRRVA